MNHTNKVAEVVSHIRKDISEMQRLGPPMTREEFRSSRLNVINQHIWAFDHDTALVGLQAVAIIMTDEV